MDRYFNRRPRIHILSGEVPNLGDIARDRPIIHLLLAGLGATGCRYDGLSWRARATA